MASALCAERSHFTAWHFKETRWGDLAGWQTILDLDDIPKSKTANCIAKFERIDTPYDRA